MIRKFLRKLLYRPVLWATHRFSSRPNAQRIKEALDELYEDLQENDDKAGPTIQVRPKDRFIIFSDQHKGGKDGSDDFMLAEKNYLAALSYYNEENYTLINLGDCEELWENLILTITKHNKENFAAEKRFVDRNAFIKVFGNHDIYWNNDPFASFQLEKIYGQKIKVYAGVLLKWMKGEKRLDIMLTHGHQGDGQSDANRFSAWFISNIWAPLQSYLSINFNTPAYDNSLKSLHNSMMFEWSAAQKDLLLITGHTHQPVFCSMTHLERLYLQLEEAKKTNDSDRIEKVQKEIRTAWQYEPPATIQTFKVNPSYFNTGCCCFDDGDITGIEISYDNICLIKWEYEEGVPTRKELETIRIEDLQLMQSD